MKHPSTVIAFIGLYVALCVVVGIALVPLPNIELMMMMVFLGGYLMGTLHGALIGSLSGFIFSAFNPWGSGLAFPPLIIAQFLGFGITGLAGGIVYHLAARSSSSALNALYFGLSGGMLTVVYHALIAVLASELAGFSVRQLGVFIAGGLAFGTVHISSNILFFIVLIPPLVRASARFSFVREFR